MTAESSEPTVAPGTYWISTLGCPKNDVDSDKLAGRLASRGYERAVRPEEADLLVVNTCAFIDAAREESVAAILDLDAMRRPGSRLAVTGCLAERNGEELAASLPEVDVVAGFGCEVDERASAVSFRPSANIPSFDLLELPRPRPSAPWAYVKVAEGCDRKCGFCAIPSFRGPQRSRRPESILAEVESLGVKEVVLVAQDLASYGRDRTGSRQPVGLVELVKEVTARVEWVRLLYLYPSSLSDRLIDAVVETGVPYFDLSLQHASGRLLRSMRRFGDRRRLMERIERIRSRAPTAALRSSFILGYPGETEDDHDELLSFLAEAELDWGAFFTFSREAGTYADGFDEECYVPKELALERLRECSELQDSLTARRRRALVGSDLLVLCDDGSRGRTYREAPEIDGGVRLKGASVRPGEMVTARCVESEGIDLVATVR